jgi:hypothetical protein
MENYNMKKHYPNLLFAQDLIKTQNSGITAYINGEWQYARPISYPTIIERIKIAWKVFTGEYDAIFWGK